MLIFIDESGTFTVARGLAPAAVSVVGALVLTEGSIGRIEKKYLEIRKTLPKEKGEVKGRLLSELQVDRVVTILEKNDALFEVVGIDMAIHSRDGVEAHKKGQENGITVNLTPEMHPSIHEGYWRLRNRLEALPLQLYVQSAVMYELITNVVELATLYFSQRQPKTLGRFEWVLDAKGKGQLTDWEDWWSFTVMPITQSRSFRKPLGQFVDGDYTYFKRFERKIPDYLLPHRKNQSEKIGLDAKKILTEHFRFSSASEAGLEMVDILTNATRRALLGRLNFGGWANIPHLMLHRKQHYIRLISLERPPEDHHYPYMQVLRHFRQGGKNILAPRFR